MKLNIFLQKRLSDKKLVYYRPQTKLRKDNVFTSVCQEFYPQEGVCTSPKQTPPLGRPHRQTSPRAVTPLGT